MDCDNTEPEIVLHVYWGSTGGGVAVRLSDWDSTGNVLGQCTQWTGIMSNLDWDSFVFLWTRAVPVVGSPSHGLGYYTVWPGIIPCRIFLVKNPVELSVWFEHSLREPLSVDKLFWLQIHLGGCSPPHRPSHLNYIYIYIYTYFTVHVYIYTYTCTVKSL